MVAAVVRISGNRRKRVLRGEHELVPIGADELSNQSLAGAIREAVGRVHEVAAERDEVIEDATALVARRTPAQLVAEGHRAQRELRNAKAAAAKEVIPHHGAISMVRSRA